MISRPTTQQLLDDCAREVRDSLLPMTTDGAARVRLEMLEQLLAACAVRSAHEMAWMDEEASAMEAYAAEVADGFPNATTVRTALDASVAAHTESLHLDDRIVHYDRAGHAFSEALEVAMRAENAPLARRGRELILARVAREADCRPGFFFPGRR